MSETADKDTKTAADEKAAAAAEEKAAAAKAKADEKAAADKATDDGDDDKPKRKAKKGHYMLKQGDTPASVAGEVYEGRRTRGRDLVLANADVKWRPGNEIKIPT